MAPTYSSNDAVAMRNFESAIEQSHDVLLSIYALFVFYLFLNQIVQMILQIKY